jgi:hypothetical protein
MCIEHFENMKKKVSLIIAFSNAESGRLFRLMVDGYFVVQKKNLLQQRAPVLLGEQFYVCLQWSWIGKYFFRVKT